jgi:4'-phosphopantetheinyl transferase
MANAVPRSSAGHVTICHAATGPVEITRLNHWLNELPYARQIAIRRKKQRADRIASLIGLQLVKRGMAGLGFSDFSLTDLRFSPMGRPKGSFGAEFSISHSGGLIACAIALNARVGIDVEPVTRKPRLSSRYLDATERRAAARNPLAGLRIWTGKEAVFKAAAAVDRAELAAVAVRGNRARLGGQWCTLWEPRIGAGFMVRLATDTTQAVITHRHIRLS